MLKYRILPRQRQTVEICEQTCYRYPLTLKSRTPWHVAMLQCLSWQQSLEYWIHAGIVSQFHSFHFFTFARPHLAVPGLNQLPGPVSRIVAWRDMMYPSGSDLPATNGPIDQQRYWRTSTSRKTQWLLHSLRQC